MHLISTLLSLICIFMLLGSIFIARNEWKLKRGWTRKRPSLLLMSFSCAKSERKWQNWQIGKLQKWSKTIFFKVVIQKKRCWFLSTFSSFNHSAVCERDSAIFCDHHSLSFQEYLKNTSFQTSELVCFAFCFELSKLHYSDQFEVWTEGQVLSLCYL